MGLRSIHKRATAFATAAFGIFLGLFTAALGQKNDDNTKTRTWTVPATIVIIPDRTPVITGTIADPYGAMIPGVQISLIDSSGRNKTVISDNSGSYIFDGLEPGEYQLKTSTMNWNEVRFKRLVVKYNQKLKLDFNLEPSGVTEIVGIFLEEDTLEPLPFSIGGKSTTKKVNN